MASYTPRPPSSITRTGTFEPFDLQVSRGQIPWHSRLFQFGINNSVPATASPSTVWGSTTTYAFPAAAIAMTVSSASANDKGTASPGTGARTVLISGLDASYNAISETITLNGQTAVTTTNSYLRINSMEVLTAGSGNTAAGIIYVGTGTVTAGVPATVYGLITTGYNVSTQAVYTVPAGYTAYVTSYTFTSTYASATPVACSGFFITYTGSIPVIEATARINSGNSFDRHFDSPLSIAEMTDIEMKCAASTASVALMTGEFHIILIKNDAGTA
jgi:hypothetical protein